MKREELNKDIHQEILNEEFDNNSRNISWVVTKIILIILISFTALYLYIDNISNKLFLVQEARVTNSLIPDDFNGFKIVQFSDIHYGNNIFYDDLVKVVKKINSLNPDIVVFTGDLISPKYKIKLKEEKKLIKLFNTINNKYGKYAVLGDEDTSSNILDNSSFNILKNQHDFIYVNGSHIAISGISSTGLGINDAYQYNENLYNIGLVHYSDLADDMKKSNLILSGNSMNGIIRLPYIGGLIRKDGSKKYVNKYYELDNSVLYVNGGIGTTSPGIRFLNHPYISLYRLSNGK